MSFFSTQPVNDIDKARQALTAFHNQSLAFPNYNESISSLTEKIGGKYPTIFLESFGFAINSIGMSVGQTEDAMESLAIKSQGKIPRKESFFNALSDRFSNPTFLDFVGATPRVALETAGDVVKGAAQIGDAVIDTGKSLLVIGPIVAVSAILFIVYARTRSIAGR